MVSGNKRKKVVNYLTEEKELTFKETGVLIAALERMQAKRIDVRKILNNLREGREKLERTGKIIQGLGNYVYAMSYPEKEALYGALEKGYDILNKKGEGIAEEYGKQAGELKRKREDLQSQFK